MSTRLVRVGENDPFKAHRLPLFGSDTKICLAVRKWGEIKLNSRTLDRKRQANWGIRLVE